MDKTVSVSNKRRIYFIEKSFQARFILKFCALVVFGGLLTIGLLYLLAMQSTTVSFVNSRVVVRSTADFLMPVLIQTVAIVIILVGFATVMVKLFVSHKIAGPLYHIKKAINELGQGDFSQDFHIRHFDQLQNLAEVFNNSIKAIREKMNTLKGGMETLKKGLDSIPENEVSENKRALLRELKKISEELNKLSSYFKTAC